MVKTECLQGVYNQYECGVKISNAGPEDSGEWTCNMEEFTR